MRDARKLVKNILIVIKNLEDGVPKMKDIEIVRNDKGEIVGYRILIVNERAFKVIKGGKDD